eukprot:CAMPEP_0172904468 /NCGR_PEP_ID=MMETSP1075-20121228/172690_1 /TAXON_ID=2916 /ORGANISM="Ceratium fusus, Strain PA161109" /LENGTH=132 /DNA_ID=CAMNT_0013761505 /DNA_START=412 /DNA_END=811 /DNA_ORIENTATION=-
MKGDRNADLVLPSNGANSSRNCPVRSPGRGVRSKGIIAVRLFMTCSVVGGSPGGKGSPVCWSATDVGAAADDHPGDNTLGGDSTTGSSLGVTRVESISLKLSSSTLMTPAARQCSSRSSTSALEAINVRDGR